MPPCLRFLCLAVVILAAPARAATAAGPAQLSDYRHDIWSAKDGVPADIDSMAQTADGWLWLGSRTGLYRYDGVRFMKFIPLNSDLLLGRAISSLAAQPNGDLWIGYAYGSGLSRLRGGHLQHFDFGALPDSGAGATGATTAVVVDVDGSVWAATADGLLRLAAGRWQRIGAAAGFPGQAARNVLRDRYDRLWAANENQLFLFDRASRRFVASGRPGSTDGLIESPDGRQWQAVGETWRRLPAPPDGALRAPAPPAQWTARSGLFDRDGNLWSKNSPAGMRWTSAASLADFDRLTGVASGITRAAPAGDRLDRPGQMASLDVRTFLEDNEGNVWVSTRDSLERFRRNKLHSVPFPSGASRVTLARDAQGRMLAVSAQDRRLWQLGAANAAAAPGARLAPASAASMAAGDGKAAEARWDMIATAADGALLLAGPAGIERRGAAGVQTIPLPPGPGDAAPDPQNAVTNMVDDGASLWVSLKNRSVHRYLGGRWLRGAGYGLPEPVLYMAADAAGHVWFAYKDNRIVEFAQGKLQSYGAAQGLDLGTVTYLDVAHGVLAVGSNGMAVLRGGRFRRVVTDDPDLLSNVSGMLMGPDGDRWFNAPRGVVHVTAAAWRGALAAPAGAPGDAPGEALDYTLLDAQHGYPGSNQTALRSPSAVAGNAGQLWFIAAAGLVMLDPATLRNNSVAPPVQILCLNTDRERFGAAETIRVKAGTTDLNIVYTAPSFTAPEQIRFRYRLEGVDQDWQDAGNRRVAYYTNLRPGEYRFQVIASNEDGVWNTAGASMAFELAPHFSQTRWFMALCLGLGAALLYLLVALRVRYVTSQLRERLRVRQLERERIARTSHDTLLQNMQGWVMCVQAVANRLRDHDAAHGSMEQLLRQADEALALGRDQAMEMRIASELRTGLPSALEATVAVLGTPLGAACALTSSGEPRELDPGVGEEAFSLGREALVNAYRRAATRIELHLHYGAREFSLQVRHDGPGPAAVPQPDGARPGHPGLAAMRQRTAAIGGRLSVDQRIDGGIDTLLTVPAQRAYLRPPRTGPRAAWAALRARLGWPSARD